MYIVIWFKSDLEITCIHNEDGSIRVFQTLEEADEFANKHPFSDKLRVISLEGVKE